MNELKAAVEDLIEETRMRELDDDQIEWRIKKFTEVCEELIQARVPNVRKRAMLIERLQILKCFYDHSSVKQFPAGLTTRENNERQRINRLQNIVKRRRMALEMIERIDPEVAQAIADSLNRTYSIPSPTRQLPVSGSSFKRIQVKESELSPQQWYFFYFNLFLLLCLVSALLLIVR